MFARVCKALQNPLRHSFSVRCFERLRKAAQVKKTSHFSFQLKEDLEAHFKRARNIFGLEI